MESVPLVAYVLWLAITVILVSFGIAMARVRNVKLPIEEGKVPVYTEACGARLDNFNATIPWVRLAVYDIFIVIACPDATFGRNMRYVLFASEIDSLEVKRHRFATGLHVGHSSKELPRTLIIWSRNAERLKSVIEGQQQAVIGV